MGADSAFQVDHADEILDLWAERARTHKFRAALEITDDGLVIGAGIFLATMGADEQGRASLSLDDERAAAVLATGYDRPVGLEVVAKLRRACALWSEGEKALAHIHLAFAGLPPCRPTHEGLRIFAADALIKSGVAPAELMRAQGFDPAPLALLKYDPDEPRDGHGRWTRGGGGIDVAVADESDKERIERERRARGQETPKDDVEHDPGIPIVPEGPLAPPAPSSGALETGPKPSDFVGQDFGKLGVGVEKPDIEVREFDPHALDRMMQRGVSKDDIGNIVDNPLIVLQQTRDKYLYLSDKGGVAITDAGKVVTTYPESDFYQSVKNVLNFVHGRVKR